MSWSSCHLLSSDCADPWGGKTDLSGFEGYGDLEAFKEDCHFGTHEFRHIGRCALVGDPKWVEAFIKVAMLFYKAEEKSFPSGEFDTAVAWACE